MARSSKAVATATSRSKSIANLDQELANEVAALKNQIGQPSGNKITINASGTFTLPEGTDIGDEFQCVVIDFISRNQFYDMPYNRDVQTAPACYAIGRNITELAPEGDSPSPQADNCATCPLNQFGSGANGKSKACSNRRLLAVLVVDPDNPDNINDPAAPIYMLDLSPSNIRSFDGMVSYIARALNKPPVGAIVTVSGRNVGTYAAVTFSDPVPNPNYAEHFARRAECQDMLYRKPDFSALAAAAAQPRGNARRATKAAPARRAAARR